MGKILDSKSNVRGSNPRRPAKTKLRLIIINISETKTMPLAEISQFYDIRTDGSIYSKRRRRLLKPSLKKHGYLEVNLTLTNKKLHILVHKLVAMKFILNTNEETCINHKDLDRLNNDVSNLEWCDYKYNNQRRGNNKIKIGDELTIREMYSSKNFTQQQIANMFGLDQGYVSQIINFKRR